MINTTEAVKEAEVELVIIRADGTKEALGKQYYSNSKWRRLLYLVRGWRD